MNFNLIKKKLFSKKILSNENKSISENNMKFYIVNGMLFTIMTCLYKSFADKFITRLGGTSLHISLYNALPGLMGAFCMLPGIIIMSKASNKKKTMSTFFLISRCIIFSFAFVPFFPKQYRPMLFVILFAFMSVPEALSVMSLQSFSGDIFSDKKRSTAIAMRNKFSTLFNVITCLILGWTFKSLVKNNSQAVFLYQICFTVAFLIGLIEIHTFMKLKEITTIQVDKMSFKAISNIFKNKKFKTFLFCSLIFHFGWQMGWPLFSIYKIKYLNADEMWLTILNVSSNIVMFFSYNYWNKLIKRRGNTFVIAFATFGMSVTPLLYAVSFNLYVLTLTGIMTGFFTSGTTTVILSALLEVCPEKNRMFYIGLHATFTNLTLSIAPMVGHTVLEHTSIYAALGVSAAFRFIGSFAFFIRNKNMSKTQSTNITT